MHQAFRIIMLYNHLTYRLHYIAKKTPKTKGEFLGPQILVSEKIR